MALPHYNPNSNELSLTLQQDSFPVILVPDDTPQKAERARRLFRSKLLLTSFGCLALLACAALLWIVLDPNKTLRLRELYIPGGILITCLLFFLIAALMGKGKEEKISPVEEEVPAIKKQFKRTTLSSLNEEQAAHPKQFESKALPSHLTQLEVYCEEWSSEPYNEIIDDAVLAEVFNDEMLAPDHMVISLKVTD